MDFLGSFRGLDFLGLPFVVDFVVWVDWWVCSGVIVVLGFMIDGWVLPRGIIV